MNQHFSLKAAVRRGLGAAALSAGVCAAFAQEATRSEATPDKTAQSEKKQHKKEKKPLSGAELYAIHCNRCHPERYATERTEAQWKTILTHMRVRANLPAEQARAIMKFLQDDSGK